MMSCDDVMKIDYSVDWEREREIDNVNKMVSFLHVPEELSEAHRGQQGAGDQS